MKKFNEKYIFVPKYLRRLWGDDGLQPMEDFESVHIFINREFFNFCSL